jgi:OPA family glycerol-3-phosphate transporter-like MFS transporter
MVYLGTGLQAFYYGKMLPNGDAAKDPANWMAWPVAMIPLSLIGLLLALRIRAAHPNTHGRK